MAENTDTAVRENQPQAQRPANQPAPLPASDRDLRWKSFRAGNPRFRVFLIVGIIVLLVAGFFLWRYFDSYEDTDDAEIDGHLNSISTRVSGHVLKLLVQDNQYVAEGTPLVEIDPKDYQVAVDRAKADLENANAGIAAARQQYAAANAQLVEAQANNVKAQNDLVRYKQLVDKQEISQQQYDQAVAAANAGAASVDAARASASAADHQVRQAQSRLAQAQANLRAAATGPQQVATIRSRAQSAEAQAELKKAALEQAELDLQYTMVLAPVNGVVTNRTVEVGQNVSVGQELMRVINLDDIWVTANFKETQLKHMQVGQRA